MVCLKNLLATDLPFTEHTDTICRIDLVPLISPFSPVCRKLVNEIMLWKGLKDSQALTLTRSVETFYFSIDSHQLKEREKNRGDGEHILVGSPA